jgi:hypothetical protein
MRIRLLSTSKIISQFARNSLLVLALVFLSACLEGENATDQLFGDGSGDPVEVPVPTDLNIQITYPAEDGASVGYEAIIEGTCTPVGSIVTISGDGSGTAVCEVGGSFSASVDVSSAGLGTVTLSAILSDSDGDTSTTVTRSWTKTSTACDSSAARAATFAGGDGITTPYLICTKQQFQNIDANKTRWFRLENDLDWGGAAIPMTNNASGFSGEFDGQGYSIRNGSISSTEDIVGIFSRVIAPAHIHDLKIDNVSVTGRHQVGILVGYVLHTTTLTTQISDIEITNSTVTASNEAGMLIGRSGQDNNAGRDVTLVVTDISVEGTISGAQRVGGVIGYVINTLGAFTATNLSFDGTVTATDIHAGGVIAHMGEGAATISNLTSTGTVTGGNNYVGGVLAYFANGTLADLTSTAEVNATGTATTWIGGLVGNMNAGTYSGDCEYTGTVAGNDNDYVGGAFGLLNDSIIVDGCIVDANVSGRDYVGGVAGYVDVSAELTNADNVNTVPKTVSGRTNVGGVTGYLNTSAVVEDSGSNSTVTGTGTVVGGLVGNQRESAQVNNSFATGDVESAGNYAGGLVGGQYRYTVIYQSYATGNVVGGADYVGGLTGGSSNNWNQITESFATGSVEGAGQYVGGLVGYMRVNNVNRFMNNFATGDVVGDANVGGLAGYVFRDVANVAKRQYALGTVTKPIGASGASSTFGPLIGARSNADVLVQTSLFFDAANPVMDEATGLSLVGQNVFGTSKTTAQMLSSATYTTAPADFDMTTIWEINATGYELPGESVDFSYPILQWMNP